MNHEVLNCEIHDLHTFSQFVEKLCSNFTEHPEQWENKTLGTFLTAMSSYAADMQNYYHNSKQDIDANIPTWKVFKDILIGSAMYE